MPIIRYALVFLGIALCTMCAVQVQKGVPGFYVSRGIADLQADANQILLGIGWLIGGLASGVFALAFVPVPQPPDRSLNPDPASG
ncbi:hypothetical protein [Paracoccus sp. (in: a-proteobacteria)]|uniref:hypothetical protein n=1 Tax=Paracoccus sp. TaxID=267 RepID=UPI002AFE2CE5|nr:hypothetical protein [Paracoccus sp. (in: a-proteobacteria)]